MCATRDPALRAKNIEVWRSSEWFLWLESRRVRIFIKSFFLVVIHILPIIVQTLLVQKTTFWLNSFISRTPLMYRQLSFTPLNSIKDHKKGLSKFIVMHDGWIVFLNLNIQIWVMSLYISIGARDFCLLLHPIVQLCNKHALHPWSVR